MKDIAHSVVAPTTASSANTSSIPPAPIQDEDNNEPVVNNTINTTPSQPINTYATKFSELSKVPAAQIDSDIDEIFHSFSHYSMASSSLEQEAEGSSSDDNTRDISYENGVMAMEECLRRWDIFITDSEINAIKLKNFSQLWSSYANSSGNLSID